MKILENEWLNRCCIVPTRLQEEFLQGSLELNHLSLPLLVSTKLEVLAALQRDLLANLAFRALHPEHNLLGGLGLFDNRNCIN